VVICTFKFRDGAERVAVFPRAGTSAILDTFAGRFAWSQGFLLRTGFPMAQVPDGETAITMLFPEKNALPSKGFKSRGCVAR
jgi:hypothetical protein